MLEIGINTNNECGKDTKEVLTNIKKAGFKNVMVAFKVGKAEETLKMAQELGLNVPFVHLSNSNNLWAKGEENDLLMANLKEQIEITAKYNVPIAVLHATQGGADQLALPPLATDTKHLDNKCFVFVLQECFGMLFFKEY